MEQTTKYFILKDSGLHHIPDMPEKPYINFDNDFSCETAGIEYEKKKREAIASSIPVDNQEEVMQEIVKKNGLGCLKDYLIQPLECEIKIRVDCTKKECNGDCVEEEIAFVKLKEETKERERGINLIMVEDAGTKDDQEILSVINEAYGRYKGVSLAPAAIVKEIFNQLKSNFIITKRQ